MGQLRSWIRLHARAGEWPCSVAPSPYPAPPRARGMVRVVMKPWPRVKGERPASKLQGDGIARRSGRAAVVVVVGEEGDCHRFRGQRSLFFALLTAGSSAKGEHARNASYLDSCGSSVGVNWMFTHKITFYILVT